MPEYKIISIPDKFEGIISARTVDLAFKKTRAKYKNLRRPLQAYPTSAERIEGQKKRRFRKAT